MYYRHAWLDIPSFVPKIEKDQSLPFVSVIISARNEGNNIAECLNSMVHQSYPKESFEVIVINDHSEDNTAELVSWFGRNTNNIRLVDLEDYVRGAHLNSYKKKAIETGISLSKGELIMTTDADCIVPEDWISTVTSYYKQHQSAMIASPVALAIPEKSSGIKKFFYAFQALDFATLQGITGAALFKKFHYMANGANLAYPKNIFTEVNGFKGVDELASGDDMFLMEKIRLVRPNKIHYLKSRMSTVTTQPVHTIKLFFNQRIRWASKSASYRDYKIKTVLSLVYAINIWCLVLLAMGFYSKSFWQFVVFVGLKFLAELFFLLPVTRFFRQRKLLFWFVLFQPFHIIYIILAGWLGSFGRYQWKGRVVK